MSSIRDIIPVIGQQMREEVVYTKWQWLIQKVRFQHTQHPPIPHFCTLPRAERTIRTMIRWLVRAVYLESIERLKNAVCNYIQIRRLSSDVQTGQPLPSQLVAAHGMRNIRCQALDAFSPGSYALSPLRDDEDERVLFRPPSPDDLPELEEADWDTWDPDSPSTID